MTDDTIFTTEQIIPGKADSADPYKEKVRQEEQKRKKQRKPNPLLGDLIPLREGAEAIGRSDRTMRRLLNQPDGPPHVRIGNQIYLHPPSFQEWWMARMTQRNPRSGR
nr:hypothetical protein 6 [Rhodospirillaceae bacterium]